MARKALLIGTGTYTPGFQALKSPLEDVRVLGDLLRNPEIGGFEVEILVDLPSANLRPKIEDWYLGHSRDDFSLLFLAGHGIKDGDRKLHFATIDTRKNGENLVRTTAISASDLSEWMGRGKAKRQAVILNCCFSGAFGDLVPMDEGAIGIEEILGPEGRVVMTATSSMNYAFESKGRELSVYGHYLAEGLLTGAAATHGSDQITLDELHQYVSQKVQAEAPAMVPQWFAKGAGQGLRIAKVAIGDPKRKYQVIFEELVERFGEEIGVLGLAKLKILQNQLNLDDSAVSEIKDRVLEPIRLRKEKITEYREIFTAGIQEKGSFDEDQRQLLTDIKKMLGLLDEDVAAVESEILAALPPIETMTEPVVVEFDRLEELLQDQKWKEANDETLRRSLISGWGVSDRGIAFLRRGLNCPTIEVEVEHGDIEVDSSINLFFDAIKKRDYTLLQNFLRAKKWREADEKTCTIMLRVAKQEDRGYLDEDDLNKFPCEDLLTIDQLWVEASNGHFGFSVQKKIWEKCGSPMNYNDGYEKFMEAVGWRLEDGSVPYNTFKFSPFHSPKGELPAYSILQLKNLEFLRTTCSKPTSNSNIDPDVVEETTTLLTQAIEYLGQPEVPIAAIFSRATTCKL